MTHTRNVTFLVLALLTILPLSAHGQDFASPPPDNSPQPLAAPSGYDSTVSAPYDNAPQPLAAPNGYAQPADAQAFAPNTGGPQPAPPVAYSPQQIDQMLAPIALYPDPLISQILMASTYPLEIVEAQRWRQNPQNAQLSGDPLQAALAQQPWDPSVKSLVAFPQVLNMLNANIQWTEQLGDAFLASQPAVMDSIQHLRQLARTSGNLNTTPQQVVSQQQGEIVIQPAQPQVVYVPYYNPTVVYGAWPYPTYQPYYFPPPPGVVFFGALGFGVGLAIVDSLWGWNHWDWYHHRIVIDDRRYEYLNRGRPPRFEGGVWGHDIDHRHGVPYRSQAVRAQYQGAATDARRNYRGYVNQAAARPDVAAARMNNVTLNAAARGMPANSHFIDHPAAPNVAVVAQPRTLAAPVAERAATTQTQTARSASTVENHSQARASAPMFESFSHGPDVRMQAARGSTSRASIPTTRSAAAPHSGSNAGHGGGDHNEHGGR